MSFTGEPIPMTLEGYFTLEHGCEYRHEYAYGEAIPLIGDAIQHNRIAGNIGIVFDKGFGDYEYHVFVEGVRLRVSPDIYRYPDVMILCNEPLGDNNNGYSLHNPNIIFEIVSPDTSHTDWGKKFGEYHDIPTVSDFLLVEQDRIYAAHFSRIEGKEWMLEEYLKLSDTIAFASVGVSLTLEEMYRKVKFAPSNVAS